MVRYEHSLPLVVMCPFAASGWAWITFGSDGLSRRLSLGLVLGKLTPGAVEADEFVLSQKKGEGVFQLLAGC